jgi:hypothetical protein
MNATNLLKLIASSFTDGSRLAVLPQAKSGILVIVSKNGYASFKASLTKSGIIKSWAILNGRNIGTR